MALTIYGFYDYPNDFAVTKADASLDECSFLLDFSRPITRIRQLFGRRTKWIGPAVALEVPVLHVGEHPGEGEFVFGIMRGEPYFVDLPKLWKKHTKTRRGLPVVPGVDGLRRIADLATHFPGDCS